MSGYSLDLRERIVAAVDAGETKTAVAKRFKVSRTSVKRYVKRAAEGCLAASPNLGPKSWLDTESSKVLEQQVESNNDWTLEQHAEALSKSTGLAVKKSAIAKYFKLLKITRKKRV